MRSTMTETGPGAMEPGTMAFPWPGEVKLRKAGVLLRRMRVPLRVVGALAPVKAPLQSPMLSLREAPKMLKKAPGARG